MGRAARDVSILRDDDNSRARKLEIAKNAKLPIHKLLAAVENEELRGRLESQWQNTAVVSTFIASISISCIFVEINLDESDPEHDAKKVVRSLFYVLACFSSISLLLATVLLIENLTTLTLIPMQYVDDLLYKMGATEGIPSVLTVVALVLLIALFPLYMFLLFAHSWEFYVILIFTIVSSVGGLIYFVWMTVGQAQFLDRYLHAHAGNERAAGRSDEIQLAAARA